MPMQMMNMKKLPRPGGLPPSPQGMQQSKMGSLPPPPGGQPPSGGSSANAWGAQQKQQMGSMLGGNVSRGTQSRLPPVPRPANIGGQPPQGQQPPAGGIQSSMPMSANSQGQANAPNTQNNNTQGGIPGYTPGSNPLMDFMQGRLTGDEDLDGTPDASDPDTNPAANFSSVDTTGGGKYDQSGSYTKEGETEGRTHGESMGTMYDAPESMGRDRNGSFLDAVGGQEMIYGGEDTSDVTNAEQTSIYDEEGLFQQAQDKYADMENTLQEGFDAQMEDVTSQGALNQRRNAEMAASMGIPVQSGYGESGIAQTGLENQRMRNQAIVENVKQQVAVKSHWLDQLIASAQAEGNRDLERWALGEKVKNDQQMAEYSALTTPPPAETDEGGGLADDIWNEGKKLFS